MMERTVETRLHCMEELPVELQRQILAATEALSPRGRTSSEDLRITLGLSEEEAERLAAVLEIA